MPEVDFYILPEATLAARLQFACRLIEKAYKQKHRIYIHANDEKEAHQLDELLWTYRDDSFLPHNLYGEGPEPTPPIQIGYNAHPQNYKDILINLNNDVPHFYMQFARVFELIISDAAAQEKGRERFKFYRAQSLDIKTYKLQTIES